MMKADIGVPAAQLSICSELSRVKLSQERWRAVPYRFAESRPRAFGSAPCFGPQQLRNRHRIDHDLLPPRPLITTIVYLAVMRATQPDSELVADLSPERSWLSEAEVVSIARCAPADEARL